VLSILGKKSAIVKRVDSVRVYLLGAQNLADMETIAVAREEMKAATAAQLIAICRSVVYLLWSELVGAILNQFFVLFSRCFHSSPPYSSRRTCKCPSRDAPRTSARDCLLLRTAWEFSLSHWNWFALFNRRRSRNLPRNRTPHWLRYSSSLGRSSIHNHPPLECIFLLAASHKSERDRDAERS